MWNKFSFSCNFLLIPAKKSYMIFLYFKAGHFVLINSCRAKGSTLSENDEQNYLKSK